MTQTADWCSSYPRILCYLNVRENSWIPQSPFLLDLEGNQHLSLLGCTSRSKLVSPSNRNNRRGSSRKSIPADIGSQSFLCFPSFWRLGIFLCPSSPSNHPREGLVCLSNWHRFLYSAWSLTSPSSASTYRWSTTCREPDRSWNRSPHDWELLPANWETSVDLNWICCSRCLRWFSSSFQGILHRCWNLKPW